MNEHDRNLLIEIRVDLADGGFEVSTGYPIGLDLILTAGHGLFPENPKDDSIRLRWFHQRDKDHQPVAVTVTRDAIAWHSKKLDAALIRCSFPQGQDAKWRYLSAVRPYDGESWASEGFPLGADTAAGSTDAFPIRGTLHAAATETTLFHLDLPASFKAPEHWGGISGAPVFVRGQIVGVIVATPTQAEGRLKAVHATSLFGDAEFARLIGYSINEGGIQALQAATRQCLDESQSAREHLAKVMGTAKATSSTLAKALISELAPSEMIAAIKRAHGFAFAAREGKAAEVLRRLLLILLPARLDPVAIECARMRLNARDNPVVPVEVRTHTGAELLMAAVEAQPAAFREAPQPGEYAYPEGVYKLDHPPKRGMADEVNDDHFYQDWVAHLINKFASGPGFDRAAHAARLQVAARRLAPTDERPRAYYVLIDEEPEALDVDTAERRAGRIRSGCPSVLFLRLEGSDERLIEETALIDPCCSLLSPPREPTP